MRQMQPITLESDTSMARKILVVDDEQDILLLVRITLEAEGYEVITAVNGREAVDRLNNDKPDLLVTDVMMPEMDGFEVLESLKKNVETEAIPVIMLTARTDARDMFRAWDMGTSIYLTKPFRPRELVAAVKRIFPGDDDSEPPKFFTAGQ